MSSQVFNGQNTNSATDNSAKMSSQGSMTDTTDLENGHDTTSQMKITEAAEQVPDEQVPDEKIGDAPPPAATKDFPDLAPSKSHDFPDGRGFIVICLICRWTKRMAHSRRRVFLSLLLVWYING
jgi:hypothetical protein